MAGAYGKTRQALDAADPVRQQLSPQQARGLLGNLAQHTYQTFDNVFYGLDTLDAAARAGAYQALTGKQAPDFMGSWDDRVSGTEILEDTGLAPKETKTWAGAAAKTAAGFGVELLLSPTALLSGPAKALTRAGRAADAAGLLRHASAAASSTDDVLEAARKYASGGAVGDELPAVGKMAAAAMGKANVPITPATVAARPLVGHRLALRRNTINSLLDVAAPTATARAKSVAAINDFLRKEGSSFADVADAPLAHTLGVGLPLGDASLTFDVLGKKGGDLLAGAMDAASHAAQWSYPGRLVGAMVNKNVNGTVGMPDQIHALRLNQLKDEAAVGATRLNSRMLTKAMLEEVPAGLLPNGARSIFSNEANAALLRMMETPKAKWTSADSAFYSGSPAAKYLVDKWDKVRKEYLAESGKWGLDSHKLSDPHGYLYVPRTKAEFDLVSGLGEKSGFDYSTMTADQLRRTLPFKVPGGTEQLRELSIDPQIASKARVLTTDEASAAYIRNLFDTKYAGHKYAPEHATELARALRNVPEENVKARNALFGTHPLESITQYTVGRQRAMGAAKAQIEALADAAVHAMSGGHPVPFTLMPTGNHIAAGEALKQISLKTFVNKTGDITGGAGMRLKEQIAARLGKNADDIDLSQYSIPQELVARLNRTMDVYKSPEAQGLLADALDQVTRIWKAGVLTWPSRWVRDFYSGFVSNYLETGDLAGTITATSAARTLMKGDYHSFTDYLLRMPKYQHLKNKPAEALEEFLVDIGSSGVFQSSIGQDIATATRTGTSALESIPGFTKMGVRESLKELAPKSSREWMDWARVKGVWGAKETKMPWFRAGERLSEYTDGLNRLTGMLTLMQQGIDPTAAAARIARAQVDYGSLTTMERGLMSKVLFPFWAYQSRMGHYVVSKIMERPGGRYAQMMRLMHGAQNYDPDRYVPTNIREQYGFYLGGDERGDTYLTDIDLPGVDLLNIVKPGGTSPVDFQRTIASVAQMGNPFMRAIAEQATGMNFFYKEPLHQVETGLDRFLMANGLPKTHPLVNTAVSLFPGASRVDSVVRLLTAKDRDITEKATDLFVNNFLGVKRRPVGKDAELRDAAEKIKDELRGHGREIPQWYVPEEEVAELPADKQELYQLYQMMQRYQRSKNKARREGAPLPRLPF